MWLAAAETPASSPIDFSSPLTWINFGVLGLLVLGFVTRRIITKGELEEEKTEITRLHEAHDKVITSLQAAAEKAVADVRAEYSKQIDALRADFQKQVAEIRAERDKADDQRNAMAETFQKEWIPTLVKFLTTTETLFPLLQKMVDRGEHK